MAITGIDGMRPASRGVLSQLRARVDAFIAGEHFSTQKAAGTAFVIRIASAGIVFGSQVLLARWLGSSEFGSYVYVWAWLLLIGDLVHFGLPLTAQRFIPEYSEAKSLDLLRGYLRGSRLLCFGLGVATALLGAALVYALRDALDPNLILPFYFACLALPAYVLSFMSDGVARSYNWMNLALIPAYVVRPLLLTAGAALLRLFGVPLDADNVVGVLAAAAWIAVLAQMVQLDHRLRR